MPRRSEEPTLFTMLSGVAWEECKELQHTDKKHWEDMGIGSILPYDRLEIGVYEDDALLGGCILMLDEHDPHIGECMCVAWMYIIPEHRGKIGATLLRKAREYTRKAGYSLLKFSKRERPYKYSITYVKV